MKTKPFWKSKTFWAGTLMIVGAVGLWLKGDHKGAYTLFLNGAGILGIRDAIGLKWKN